MTTEQTILETEASANPDTTSTTTTAAPSVLETALGTQNNDQVLDQSEKAAFDFIPEKFRVAGDAGVDLEASSRKMAESYAHLQTRMISGEAPPKSADEYKFEVEGVNMDALKADPNFKPFVEEAHKLGINDQQMNFFMKEISATLSAMPVPDKSGLTPMEAQAALREEWKEPDVYAKNLKTAFGAVKSFVPGDQQQHFIENYGNDPLVIKMLAKIGAELNEDTVVGLGKPVISSESAKDLMKSEAYWNPNHPEHKQVTETVRRHFQVTAGRD